MCRGSCHLSLLLNSPWSCIETYRNVEQPAICLRHNSREYLGECWGRRHKDAEGVQSHEHNCYVPPILFPVSADLTAPCHKKSLDRQTDLDTDCTPGRAEGSCVWRRWTSGECGTYRSTKFGSYTMSKLHANAVKHIQLVWVCSINLDCNILHLSQVPSTLLYCNVLGPTCIWF